LRTVLIDVDGLALLNCLENCGSQTTNGKIAIINVGGSFTTLAITDNNNLPFIRDIGYAGNDIVSNLSSQFDVEPGIIHKNLFGAVNSADDRLNIKNALPYACQRLIEDVSESLRYYSANEKVLVDQIYVSGGFAVVDGFVELFKRSFTANVQLWNPFETFADRVPSYLSDFLEKQGASMAVAAGLAMRTI
jgi:Tfp pilus assembly PilM family ATPase